MHHLDLLQGNLCCGGSSEEGERTDQTHQEPRWAGLRRGEHSLFSSKSLSLCHRHSGARDVESVLTGALWECSPGVCQGEGTIIQLSSLPAGKLPRLATWPWAVDGPRDPVFCLYIILFNVISKLIVFCLFFKVDSPFCLASVPKHCLLALLESMNVDLVFDMVDMLCFRCWFQFFSSSLFSHSCWATEDSVSVTLEPPVSSSRWMGSGPTSLPALSPPPCRRPSPWVTRECTAALKTGLWTLGRNMCSSS